MTSKRTSMPDEEEKKEMERIEQMLSQSAINKIKNFTLRNSITNTADIKTYTDEQLLSLIEILKEELKFLSANSMTFNSDTYNTILLWIQKLRTELNVENRDSYVRKSRTRAALNRASYRKKQSRNEDTTRSSISKKFN